MEKRGKLLKVIHFIVIVVSIALYAYLLIKYGPITSSSIVFRIAIDLLALLLALIYLIMSYKKDASGYYKVFMWLLVISQVVENASILSEYQPTMIDVFKNNFNLVLFTLIAGAKDYGKKLSYLLAICLVAFNAYAVFDVITMFSSMLDSEIAIIGIIDRIGQLLLAITASFMICGKYLDKDNRGTI